MPFDEQDWALILGGSSGFGLATAKKLASRGMKLCLVHRDLRGPTARLEPELESLRTRTRVVSLNLDALSDEGRAKTLTTLLDCLGPSGEVKVLLHSIAHGNLKPVVGETPELSLQDEDMARTVYAMGTSLLTWVQEIHRAGLFAADARVLSLTSEGSHLAWPGYGAVSAAKAALEAVSRTIAAEMAPFGIRCNVVQAGVTDTPALKHIPGSREMLELAARRNPMGRATRPEDVADAIYLLCRPEAAWINGAVLRVDGGEAIAVPYG